jgi:AAA15 family ATPase/GTPase
MLIGFKVRNFRSFADEQAFSFSTSSDSMHASTHCLQTGMKSVRRLSKAAIVFGPNGSGKTNLISAFAVMRDIVLHSTIFSETEFSDRHTPFRFGASVHQSTEFEIDLLLDRIRYRYGFSYDANGIRAERLLVYCTGKSQRWFERVWDDETRREVWAPFSQNFSGPRAMWRDATRSNSLFLTTAAQLNAEQLRPLFHWFEHGIELVFPSEPANLARVATSIQDAAFKKQMLEFLRAADIHVHDVRVPEQDPEPAESVASSWFVPNKRSRAAPERSVVEFSHSRGGSLVWLQASDESAGTQRLASLFGPLLAAIEHGKLLLIDEFDLSLHPLVARYLLQLINDSTMSDRGAQLLLTSHNTTLMDVNVLRRDEIWLMALDENDASQLSPVWRSPVPPRKHELIGKGYLRGRYGAVPTIRPEEIKRAPTQTNSISSPSKMRPKTRFSIKSLA